MASCSNPDDKDKLVMEKMQIIKALQREIEFKNAGRNRIILPHDLAILIYEHVKNNNYSHRPSVFIVNHDGHRIISIEKLI